MKKYVMNKNVNYGKKAYAKGQEICDGDEGFKEMVQSGHANELNFKDNAGASMASPVVESVESMDEMDAPKKGKRR
jgi:hypothetical protein